MIASIRLTPAAIPFSPITDTLSTCTSFTGISTSGIVTVNLPSLSTARLSPTAKNMQRERLLVVNTEEGIEKIKQCTMCDFGASTIIIISYEKDDEQVLVNIYIAYTGKWCTYVLWLDNLRSFHWAAWGPVFGFLAQIYLGLWTIWQVIKKLWRAY